MQCQMYVYRIGFIITEQTGHVLAWKHGIAVLTAGDVKVTSNPVRFIVFWYCFSAQHFLFLSLYFIFLLRLFIIDLISQKFHLHLCFESENLYTNKILLFWLFGVGVSFFFAFSFSSLFIITAYTVDATARDHWYIGPFTFE